ncbi:MAG: hypothetical protein KAS63_09840 [Candidatus Heimdallarchaeota archaeon]|nr:hypothetical protein [Candidatus Heimdallarchaeota archaeon]MCK4955652.1 hypothetical protein [Candidatus Heimdallarchaeota archaeon]
MVHITEEKVMDYFLELMNDDEIDFLINKEEEKRSISELITTLKKTDEIHDKIQTAKKLWKKLFEVSMVQIDTDKKGYDDLFKYFDEFVNFEELIFASDSFYRDHTLHSLLVYFLGEYLFNKPEYSFLFGNFYSTFKGAAFMSEYLRKLEAPQVFGDLYILLERVSGVLKYEDSVRCVIALTHDLGYPLKKIAKINKSIGKILPFFSISKFGEFNFQFETVQQFYIENLLELISFNMSFEIEYADFSYDERQLVIDILNKTQQIMALLQNLQAPDEIEFQELKNALSKITEKEADILRRIFTITGKMQKDISSILRYSNDFEQYRHGIMSAYMLMKTLNAFSNIQIAYSDPSQVPIADLEIDSINAKLQILKAMSDHTSPGFQIRDFNNYSEALILFDEIEEFSRISRANQFRQFVNEFCKTELSVKDGCLNIDFIFDDENVADLNPEIAFKDKCMKFLRIFDIPNLSEEIKLRFRSIGKLPTNSNTYELQIEKNHAKILINDKEEDMASYLKTKDVFQG